jgi:hypothetical protein
MPPEGPIVRDLKVGWEPVERNKGQSPGEWGTHLNLFQEEVGLHKTVVHEATGCLAVLQEAGWVGT